MNSRIHLPETHGQMLALHRWVALGLILLFIGLYFVSRPAATNGVFTIDSAHAEIANTSSSQSKRVGLPHILDDEEGEWQTQVVRYSLDWPKQLAYLDSSREQMALLLPRVGVRYRVWLNGIQIANVGWYERPEHLVLSSWFPQLIQFPPSLLMPNPEANRIEIDVVPQLLERSGLGVALIGNEKTLKKRHDSLYTWQVTGTWMMVWASLFMALLALALRQASKERVFDWMVIMSLAHAIRMVLSVMPEPPMSFEAYFYIHRLAFTVYCSFLFLFIREYAGLELRASLWASWGLLIVGIVWLGVTLFTQNYDLYRIWALVIAVVGVLNMFALCAGAWKQHKAGGLTNDLKLILVVSAFTLATGIRDYLVVQLNFEGLADIRWMTLGSLALMVAFSWVLVRRANASVTAIKTAKVVLEEALKVREQELRDAFEQLKEVDRQRAVELERRRMMRDMHDGLGSQLVQTLNLVTQRPETDGVVVAEMLQHALNELRMNLDSMEPMQGDLATVMATLRPRVGPALTASGIKLEWRVTEVSRLEYLESRRVMHLFRCLQEIFANVVKHSCATVVKVWTHEDDDHVYLTINDNGKGLTQDQLEGRHKPSVTSGGRGLLNLKTRARSMGADLLMSNSMPGLKYQFVFPKTLQDFKGSNFDE